MSKIGSYVLDQQIAEDEKSIPQIMKDMDDQVTDLFAAWDRFLESESGIKINSNTAIKGEDNE
jgi:hypothetical protein